MALYPQQVFSDRWRLYTVSDTLYTDPHFQITAPDIATTYGWQVPAAQSPGTRALMVDASGVISYGNIGGDGLVFAAGVLSVGGTTNRITVSADAIDIASTYIGQSSITTVGTLTAGDIGLASSVITGTLPVAKGGLGVTSITSGALITGNGTSAVNTLTGTTGQVVRHNGSAWVAAGLATTDLSDFSEGVDDRVFALLVPGTAIGITYNDPANTITVSNDGVASLALSSLGWLTPSSSTGAVTLSPTAAQAANRVIATPDGTTGAVSLRSLVSADIPQTLTTAWLTNFTSAVTAFRLDQFASATNPVTFGQAVTFNNGIRLTEVGGGTDYINIIAPGTITTSYSWTMPAAQSPGTRFLQIDASGVISYATTASGSVTSIGLDASTISWLTVGSSPITTSGDITLTATTGQTANRFLATPNGTTGAVGLRAIVSADIPQTLTSAWLTDFNAAVRLNRLDQMAAPTAAVSMGSQLLTNLASPVSSTDAATRGFVEAAIVSARTYKGTANASLANPTAATGTGTWVNGDFYRITVAGSAAFGFLLNVGDFVIYNGTGWDKIDNTDPTVAGTTNRITVTGSTDTGYTVDIASAYIGQSTITTLGTIGTGAWNATAITAQYGGTGRSTLTANSLLAGNGTSLVNLIAPGAAGQVLRSDGTAFSSAALIDSDIPTLLATKISDFDAQVRLSRLDQMAQSTSAVTFGAGGIRLIETGGGADYVGLLAPSAIATSYSWTLPNAQSPGTRALLIDGTGVISYGTITSGTVTSVAQTVPSWLSVSGSPVTSSGTLAITAATGQTANRFLATPNGSTGAVDLRAIVAADLPLISLTAGVSGALPPANGGTGLTTLTANSLLVGAGTGNVTFIAPGTAANFLRSNGTVWSSTAIGINDIPTVTAAKGGTGRTTLTSNNLLAGNGTGTVNLIAPGANLNVLASNGTLFASTALTLSYISDYHSNTTDKGAARAATTAALTLTSATATTITNSGGLPTSLDGVTLAANDRILVKDQVGAGATGAAANGWYLYTAGNTWTRWTGADTSAKMLPGSSCYVSEGTVNNGRYFTLTTAAPITLGTTQLTFAQVGVGTSSWGAWQTLTLVNSWTADTIFYPSRRTNAYRVRGSEVEVSLCVTNASAALNVTITTLPAGARPLETYDLAGLSSTSGSVTASGIIAIRADGTIVANQLAVTGTQAYLTVRGVIQTT